MIFFIYKINTVYMYLLSQFIFLMLSILEIYDYNIAAKAFKSTIQSLLKIRYFCSTFYYFFITYVVMCWTLQ